MSSSVSTATIVFNKFDTDGSGSIDAKEFQALCYNLGHMLTQTEIKYALLMLDSDGSGVIELKEFQSWWGSADRWEKLFLDEQALKQRTAAANVFRRFDPTGSGNIKNCDFMELHQTLTEFNLTQKSVDQLREDLDKNRDMCIQFSEYIEWLGRQYNWADKIPGASSTHIMDKAYDSKMSGETRPRGPSQPNLDKIQAIPSRKVLMIVNHFVVSTADFVNKMLVHCEQKLGKISMDVQRLEILLRILEGKLDSIDWLAKSHPSSSSSDSKPPAAAANNSSPAGENNAGAAAAVPPPAGVPPPPGAGVPPPPGAGLPPPPADGTPSPTPAAAAAAAAGGESAAAPPAIAPPAGPKLKDDPRFVKYFRMLKLGVPPPVIEMKMQQEGYDKKILSLDPEGPASAANALTPGAESKDAPSSNDAAPPSQAPPPPAPAAAGGAAAASKPQVDTAGISADARALVTVGDGNSESEDDDDEFED